jgi:hypothetical protein
VQENNHTAHVYSRGSDSVTGVIVTDNEYPIRVAFSLLNKVLDEFLVKVPPGAGGRWTAGDAGVQAFKPTLDEYVRRYQDPRQADTIMKVQQELDETKIELVCVVYRFSRSEDCRTERIQQHKTIESVLERGEKLDNLVERSNALSMQSKAFYKTAKKVCVSSTVRPFTRR